MNTQTVEKCSFCGEEFSAPVALHHDESECNDSAPHPGLVGVFYPQEYLGNWSEEARR